MKFERTTNWRSMLLAGLVAFAIAAGGTAALAATSPVKNVGTFAGRTYQNQSLTQNLAPSNIRTYTYANMTAGASPPANYFGAQPRTFSGGTLCAAGAMSHNSAGIGGLSPNVVGICDPGVGHYGAGRTTHYDGSAYNTFSTYATSPNVYP